MPFEKQIVVLFAGTSGFLDDVPVAGILKFEENFIKYLETNRPEILQGIRDKKEITEDNKKALIEAIEKFKKERM
jgi:F-type H+-transporting ATPase subunit alpha